MIVVDNQVISDDIKERKFVCDLSKCKGACCVEGDLGAPLEKEELAIMEDVYEKVKPYMTEAGIKAVEEEGIYVEDWEGDYSTPIINGKECAYAIIEEDGTLKCAIEQAYLDKKIDYHKPISCHLYPIRITKYDQYDALNYDEWSICADACSLGEKLQVPVYKFLKGPLERKYGEKWYRKLCKIIEQEET
ncbi:MULTISPECIES: DUF3109 family protein [Persicobacter]|uniref:DUF3109 domain-containing protein n=1 Tax=Persicobacter diffluens TaxID=981 RepID=A0AAN5AK87_9BACT|nr:DUF3109 family protein [Persicobacter sp. CCB-QB2]GJM61779.1 hypothetical protein PEDI_23310 [Persicobacter diffluens]